MRCIKWNKFCMQKRMRWRRLRLRPRGPWESQGGTDCRPGSNSIFCVWSWAQREADRARETIWDYSSVGKIPWLGTKKISLLWETVREAFWTSLVEEEVEAEVPPLESFPHSDFFHFHFWLKVRFRSSIGTTPFSMWHWCHRCYRIHRLSSNRWIRSCHYYRVDRRGMNSWNWNRFHLRQNRHWVGVSRDRSVSYRYIHHLTRGNYSFPSAQKQKKKEVLTDLK